jgi:hypothetical protein
VLHALCKQSMEKQLQFRTYKMDSVCQHANLDTTLTPATSALLVTQLALLVRALAQVRA